MYTFIFSHENISETERLRQHRARKKQLKIEGEKGYGSRKRKLKELTQLQEMQSMISNERIKLFKEKRRLMEMKSSKEHQSHSLIVLNVQTDISRSQNGSQLRYQAHNFQFFNTFNSYFYWN